MSNSTIPPMNRKIRTAPSGSTPCHDNDDATGLCRTLNVFNNVNRVICWDSALIELFWSVNSDSLWRRPILSGTIAMRLCPKFNRSNFVKKRRMPGNVSSCWPCQSRTFHTGLSAMFTCTSAFIFVIWTGRRSILFPDKSRCTTLVRSPISFLTVFIPVWRARTSLMLSKLQFGSNGPSANTWRGLAFSHTSTPMISPHSKSIRYALDIMYTKTRTPSPDVSITANPVPTLLFVFHLCFIVFSFTLNNFCTQESRLSLFSTNVVVALRNVSTFPSNVKRGNRIDNITETWAKSRSRTTFKFKNKYALSSNVSSAKVSFRPLCRPYLDAKNDIGVNTRFNEIIVTDQRT